MVSLVNIPLGRPFIPESAMDYLEDAVRSGSLSGDNKYTKKCNDWLTEKTSTFKALLTPSCTHALELAAILCNIQAGDEVIMPSFTFPSTANAFVLRGARIIFIDIRPDTMNMDENLLEQAISSKTKVIVPVHYAGVSCEMERILEIAKAKNIMLVEDAAQGLMSSYKGRSLGTLGNFGCLSFHDTKNFTSGEGGAILINDREQILRAEIVREKGTNRAQFFRGFVDKYSWVDIGSSYLPSDLTSALLFSQLEVAEHIQKTRMDIWQHFMHGFKDLEAAERVRLPFIPDECEHNAHIFYLRMNSIEERSHLIAFLREKNISSAFHYVPLHSSIAGQKFGEFRGEDRYTTSESEKLIRLPVFTGLSEAERAYIVENVNTYFRKHSLKFNKVGG